MIEEYNNFVSPLNSVSEIFNELLRQIFINLLIFIIIFNTFRAGKKYFKYFKYIKSIDHNFWKIITMLENIFEKFRNILSIF